MESLLTRLPGEQSSQGRHRRIQRRFDLALSGLQLCSRLAIWKIQLVGLEIKDSSIVILFRMVHNVQHMAAKQSQMIRRSLPLRDVEMARKSGIPAGFHAQARRSRTKQQWKKIWLASSRSPHSVHNPLDGPCLIHTCSEVGSLFLINCHKKILSLSGSLAAHTSLKKVTSVPWHSLRYADRVCAHIEHTKCMRAHFFRIF